jgi:ribosomal-protein-alanine N-acetyltransferase
MTLKKEKAIALVHPKNSASIKCIEKLGLSYVKAIRSNRGERLVYSLEF